MLLNWQWVTATWVSKFHVHPFLAIPERKLTNMQYSIFTYDVFTDMANLLQRLGAEVKVEEELNEGDIY